VHQGCPLSPLLYVTSMEVLAANLRSHPSIVGLRLPGIPDPLPVLPCMPMTLLLSRYQMMLLVLSSLLMRGLRRVLVLSLTFLNVRVCGFVLGAIALTLLCQSSGPLLKIKVLRVFLGNSFMDDSNWLPHVKAVEKCLNS